jgi:hypothetical protein
VIFVLHLSLHPEYSWYAKLMALSPALPSASLEVATLKHRFLSLLALLAIGAVTMSAQTIYQQAQSGAIKLGTSGGNVNDRSKAFCCSGTLGALVTKNGTNYILSNNHVLGRSSTAVVGEDISQPGMIDSGCIVRTTPVADFFQAAPLGTSNVDAAIATAVSGRVTTTGEILGIGVPNSTPGTATVGMGVAKAGRTTGLTCSSVGSVNTSVSVQYQQGCNQGKKFVVNYTNQVVINSSSFSAGGDSGSLIVSSTNKNPVALLYAGSSSTTIGNPIQHVINALGVSFVGTSNPGAVSCPSGGGGGGGGGPRNGVGLGTSELMRAQVAKERSERDLFLDPAVQGVGIGEHPDNPGEAVLVIYVIQGQAHGRIPEMIDGVRTQIVRTDRFVAYGWNEKSAPQSCSAK